MDAALIIPAVAVLALVAQGMIHLVSTRFGLYLPSRSRMEHEPDDSEVLRVLLRNRSLLRARSRALSSDPEASARADATESKAAIAELAALTAPAKSDLTGVVYLPLLVIAIAASLLLGL